MKNDLLFEICVEELPPKSLLKLGEALLSEIKNRLEKARLSFSAGKFYVSPRHLGVIIFDLDEAQTGQEVEKKGPALKAAYDEKGEPTKACLGFANSLGLSPKDLIQIQ